METRIFVPCGGGWSRDKETSQCKAVTEALERWAYRSYCRSSREAAGMDLDPTSNGFAALPSELGEERLLLGAYCESLERWLLGRIWDHGDIPLRRIQLEGNSLTEIFAKSKGELHCLGASFPASPSKQIPERETFFILCLFKTRNGGVIPGSACGTDFAAVVERAATEAFINVTAFELMKKKNMSDFKDILEKRLWHFGSRANGYDEVLARINDKTTAGGFEIPEVIFSKRLPGPWEPEVLVHRVLVDGTEPVTHGGADRFVI